MPYRIRERVDGFEVEMDTAEEVRLLLGIVRSLKGQAVPLRGRKALPPAPRPARPRRPARMPRSARTPPASNDARILEALKAGPQQTVAVAQAVGVSRRYALICLKALVAAGRVHATGIRRGLRWHLGPSATPASRRGL